MARRNSPSAFGPAGKEYPSSAAIARSLEIMSEPRSRNGQMAARLLVWGSITTAMVLIALLCLMTVRNVQLTKKLDATLTTQYNPSYRVRFADVGAQVVRAYYAAQPAPLPLAQGLVWSSASTPPTSVAPTLNPPAGTDTSVPSSVGTLIKTGQGTFAPVVSGVAFVHGDQAQTPGTTDAYQERLTYTATVNQMPYRVFVDIGIPSLADYTGTPVVLSTPVLLPDTSAGTEVKVSTAPKSYNKIDLNGDATTQLAAWAAAYTLDDRATLKQIAQDDRADMSYRGLGGGWKMTPGSLQVAWSFRNPSVADSAVVEVTWRVEVAVTPAAGTQPGTTDPNASTITQEQRMDLLVTSVNSGLPAVSDWGPPGSFIDLEARGAAVATEDLPAPSASASVAP